ncbi:MAG: hypothetical protein RBR82_06190 [Pseudomonas sp.]|nr:hypothetical protein [Pseudomonas sp.]
MALQAQYSEVLTNVGLQYGAGPDLFKANRVFPVCPVTLMSSQYPVYPKEYWTKNEAGIRKLATESKGGTHAREFGTYSCQDISYHEDVATESIKNDPVPLNPQKAATRRVTKKISLFDEIDFVTRFFTTGVWTSGSNPTTKWDAANSTPLLDIDTYKRNMRVATGGFTANKIVMSEPVYDCLKRHSTVTGQLGANDSKMINSEILARILEVQEVIVMSAVYDTAAYGATSSHSYIAGNSLLFLHVTENPSLEDPSAGYNFGWNGFGVNGYGVTELEVPLAHAIRVEAHNYHDMRQIAADLGVFVAAPLT